MLAWIRRVLDVRTGEGAPVALLLALLAAVEAARGSAEVAADTLFLSRFGVEFLPHLYVVLGGISLVAGLAHLAAAGRYRTPLLPAAILVAIAALLGLERVAMLGGATLLYPVVWLTVSVAAAILLTLTWTTAGGVLDARQARRLFPLLTGAAILGGFGGTLAAGPIAGLVGAENLLLLPAGLLLTAAGVAVRLARRHVRPTRGRGVGRASVAGEIATGFRFVRGSPLFRLVAVAYLLFAVLLFSVSFPFYQAVSLAFPTEAELATTLGLISAAVTAASFLVAIVVARPLYARFGVATAALALPVVYLGGFALWIVSFSLASAIAFRMVQQVIQRGISNAAWSAFATTVPAERRAQVLAFVDGVPGQLGITISGLLLLAASAGMAREQVFLLGLAAAAACLAVVWQVRRRYGESLIRTLRSGLAEQLVGEAGDAAASPPLGRDPQTVVALRAALADPSPAIRRLAVEMLGQCGRRDVAADVTRMAADPEPEVRIAAIGALALLGRPPEPLLASLGDADDGVRAAAVRALSGPDDPAAIDRLAALAADPSPAVRAAVAAALIRAGEEDRPHVILVELLESSSVADRVAGLAAVAELRGHAPTPAMFDGLADPAPAVRAAAVRAAAAVDVGLGDPVPVLARAIADPEREVRLAAAAGLGGQGEAGTAVLLEVLEAGPGPAQEAALTALEADAPGVVDRLTEWALAEMARAGGLRAARRDLAGSRPTGTPTSPPAGPEAEFLAVLLERRREEVEERVLRALSILGVPEASGVIRRCLRASDPEIRAQALEAIDVLGDRRIARALVRLIEDDPDEPAERIETILDRLADDRDPWIRALALRALARRQADAGRALADRIRDDPDPLVREAAGQPEPDGGGQMPETRDTLGLVDRVLFLRGVPIFARLSPEHLQRIATAASERLYPAGERIFREGDLGDEMLVIVEGRVRIVKRDGDGERFITALGPGAPVGELAVLREMPRAATVIAEEPGVRCLAIAGEGLTAILRERPEAAMAMLATLADRLSRT